MIAASTTELTLRMLVSLALIGGIALLAMRLARGRLRAGVKRSGLGVLSRHQLSKASSVAVVQAGERYFLVGVNDHAVTLLAEGDDLILAAEGESTSETNTSTDGDVVDVRSTSDARKRRSRDRTGSSSSGMTVLETLREKTVRRG